MCSPVRFPDDRRPQPPARMGQTARRAPSAGDGLPRVAWVGFRALGGPAGARDDRSSQRAVCTAQTAAGEPTAVVLAATVLTDRRAAVAYTAGSGRLLLRAVPRSAHKKLLPLASMRLLAARLHCRMPVLNKFAHLEEPRVPMQTPDISIGASPAAEEAGQLLNSVDWAATPLGPRSRWSRTLSDLVDVVLASKSPMAILWGPHLNLIYNGGYVRVLGSRHPGAMGQPMQDVWPEVWNEVAPLMHAAMAGQPVRVRDAFYKLTRDGDPDEAWFDFTLTPVQCGSEPVQGVLLNLAETTYRKRLEASQRASEASLREMNQRKDAFVATLAHELRNPLAPIALASRVLGKVKDDPAKVVHYADLIGRHANHLRDLVEELLDISRIAHGLMEIRHDLLDVREVAKEALEQAMPAIESRRHLLQTQVPPRAVLVQGDHKRLVQLLVNLLQNAAKFTPPGGRVRLEVDDGRGKVRIRVTDNGEGMNPDFLRSAFEMFSQAPRPCEDARSGLGIGLALVKSLAQMHGGSVCAHSAGLGQGSEFEVVLPSADAPSPVSCDERSETERAGNKASSVAAASNRQPA